MAEIRINSEEQLIEILKGSDIYSKFKSDQLERKIGREKEASELIRKNEGIYRRFIK